MSTVTIIHTADLHGKLIGQAGTALARLKSEHPGCVLLDSGDAVGVGNLSWLCDRATLDAMARLGYQALCLGNRETHVWARMMAAKLGAPRFPLLCANLRSHVAVSVQPYVIIQSEGVSIAVVGLTVPMVRPGSWPTRIGSMVFDDPISVARRIVPELRQRADLLILLTHLGIVFDKRLAEEVPGIDVILGGHDHVETHTPVPAGSSAIIHPGFGARYAALVKIEVTEGVRAVEARLTPLRG
ncbi:MAG: metallophosphoesterase [Armatimonadota bacterium]